MFPAYIVCQFCQSCYLELTLVLLHVFFSFFFSHSIQKFAFCCTNALTINTIRVTSNRSWQKLSCFSHNFPQHSSLLQFLFIAKCKNWEKILVQKKKRKINRKKPEHRAMKSFWEWMGKMWARESTIYLHRSVVLRLTCSTDNTYKTALSVNIISNTGQFMSIREIYFYHFILFILSVFSVFFVRRNSLSLSPFILLGPVFYFPRSLQLYCGNKFGYKQLISSPISAPAAGEQRHHHRKILEYFFFSFSRWTEKCFLFLFFSNYIGA